MCPLRDQFCKEASAVLMHFEGRPTRYFLHSWMLGEPSSDALASVCGGSHARVRSGAALREVVRSALSRIICYDLAQMLRLT